MSASVPLETGRAAPTAAEPSGAASAADLSGASDTAPHGAPSADELRGEFLLDPDVVFLNHGSFGACPRPVFESYQRWQRELEREPVEFLGRRFFDLMPAARAALAEYVGAGADDVVYVPNATTGINIVARSLDLAPGDEVLVTDHAYGACDRVWRFMCAKRGAAVRRVDIDVPVTTHEELVDHVWASVTEATKLVFLSHITSVTGLVLPVAQLCARARDAGVLSLIDGAHAPGQVDLDVMAVGADFYAGNCHKWLCSPKGAGFLHARPEVQDRLEPLIVSWGWENELEGVSKFIDEQEYTGTRDIAAYLAVPMAIEYQRQRDWGAVRDRCHQLVREARERLLDFDGVSAIHPDDSSWYVQMESVRVDCDAEPVQRALYDRFGIEVVVHGWRDTTMLRVAVQGYNSQADINALIEALGTLRSEGVF
jgi:isopenicillin-N epimerase